MVEILKSVRGGVKIGVKPQFSLLMINHDVVRLNVSMHNSLLMAEIEGLHYFLQVKADIVILKGWIELLEINVVNKLKNQRCNSRIEER